MKRMIAALCMTTMLLATCTACAAAPAADQGGDTASPAASTEATNKIGLLTVLNMKEEESVAVGKQLDIAKQYLREKGYITGDTQTEPPSVDQNQHIYFDTLDSMVMGLEAGTVNSISVPLSTGKYLLANNDKLEMYGEMTLEDIEKIKQSGDMDVQMALDATANGFAFMFSEKNKDLRDEFDKAIDEMQADGTLDKLVEQYIDNVSLDPITFENNGSRTIKVAVTGSLPPMDYVAPDGTFAGFNTAILAEIGKRLGVNIELVQTDSIGRAAALSSGTADAVFWTRVNLVTGLPDGKAPEEGEAPDKAMDDRRKSNPAGSNELDELLEEMRKAIPPEVKEKMDMPEGTVVTDPYFRDINVGIKLK